MADEGSLKSSFVGPLTREQSTLGEYYNDTTLGTSSESYLQELYTKIENASVREPAPAKN